VEKVELTTVSVDPNVMRLAKRRMKALGIRKFSQYVGLLLEKDQRAGGSLVVIKRPRARKKH
jgi:hypothetical protein